MNRRRLLVYLTILLYLMQLAVIVFSYVLSNDHSRLNLLVGALIAIAIGAIDVAVIRYLLATLRRTEMAYSQNVSRKLEQSFESYQQQAAREEQLIREIGISVEQELAQARAALAEQSVDEVDDHLRTSLAIASKTRSSYCDNVTVSAVLESKSRQCANAGVCLNAHVSLPVDLPLPDIDVAALLFNLIDNALHECEELAKADASRDDLRIDVRSQIRMNQFFLEVENPSREGGNTRRVAATRSARQSGSHGWGTQVVSSIVEQYGGIAEFKEERGTFTASVMIPLPDGADLS